MNDQYQNRATISSILNGTPRPLWSVMIPNYNSANYLRQTLKSVLDQDPGPDIMQIEVIDDHSTKDDPKAVVEEVGRGRVGFYQQPQNVGFIRNFETCLQRARGQLIHQLHGDDCVQDGFYRKMQQVFEHNPEIGAAFCRHIYIDADGHWHTISRLEKPESGVLSNWLEQIAIEQRIATPSIVVRRSVYEHLGGFDRRIVCCGEDWEMWVRIAAHYPVAYEPEPLALYRFKPLESLTPKRIQQIMQDMRMASEIIQSYLPNYLPQSTAAKLLNKARKNYALWSIEKTSQMLSKGDIGAGFELFHEVLKCHKSFETVVRAILKLLKSQLIHTLTQTRN
ncbi:family 2 glycosyl transferase [Brasilonema octagenarum UFV-E1]|uniref:Family 2 glycosyl transferase n=2 Tax=Brasilonema TaxID=383614 RepID=A0A856MC30_9CYAN|nr:MULTISPECIES: glycosyltransferase [Brasilonema]NMF63048.1 family 2 glycosyl transferase [Brasilonema octagenarum UFV-OR1]QDL07251.1 family 2 glycosyl transferase [Brasilonema sennae CENA114]QDL13614.1 family 2 glycosyl transferase [Brasilonema octagenarum UFV-E1]